jgi:hypothetical protein
MSPQEYEILSVENDWADAALAVLCRGKGELANRRSMGVSR